MDHTVNSLQDASCRLATHLRDAGAPTAGVARTFKIVDGVMVPALLVFLTAAEGARAAAIEAFDGFPVVWNVSYAVAA